MGMYLRENGIYYLKIKINGSYKRISLETTDIKTAKEIYNAYLLDKVKSKLITNNQSHHHTEIQSPQTLTHIKETKTLIKPLYIQYMESCKLKGLVSQTMWYKEILLEDLYLNKIFNLEDLSQESLNQLVQYWNKEKPSCIRKQTANLKAFLNHCIKSQKFNSSIYHSITFPSTSDTGTRETTISEFDYKYMRMTIKDKDFLLYLETLWETGCRPNEIVNLKKNDIDFAKGTTKLYQSKTKKFKTVYLTDELLNKFKKCKEQIFLGHDKQKEYYAKKFRNLKDQLNLNKEYCLYAFRHSFGTRILNKTKDIHLVSKLLGHSDISITARHYINRSDDEIRQKLIAK